ncbi:MAG: glutathione transport system permease protein, partial [Gaiellaceae bacterium]|nr:glutathione transport system permease protein [Gaiellaceae bacterium]
YIVRRLLYSIPVLIAASFMIFVFVAKSSDPLAFLRMQPRVDQSTIQRIIEREHLEENVIVRYGYWARDAATDKFGNTLLGDRPIWPDLVRVMGNTAQLVIVAELIAILFAIFIGVYSAVRQYSAFDYSFTTFSFLGLATPVFWLALMLQVVVVNIFLNFDIRVFYISNLSSAEPEHFLLDRIQHLALPVIVLAVASIAQYSRYMRAAMLEVVNSDYVRTARAKGLNERGVIMKHAFRNALIPLTTVVALNFGVVLGGAVVTETVFSLDGMGLYFITNLIEGDPYPVMAWLMVTAILIVFFNLVADVLYGFLDPRVRYD